MADKAKKFSEEQIAQAMKCETVEELMAFAKKEGVELTEEQAKKFLAEAGDGELSEETLSAVAGGGGGYPDTGTPEWERQ